MDEEARRLFAHYQEMEAEGTLGFFDVDEYVTVIEAYICQSDFQKAGEVLRRAQSHYPEAVELKLKEAEIFLETDVFDKALALIAEVEEVEPYFYDAYILKGHTLICLKRYEEARASFLKAAEQGADEVDVAMGLAQTEVEAGNFEEAWKHTDRIIGNDTDTIETCNRFVDLSQRGNRLPEAMLKVRALLKSNPYSILYWKTLVDLGIVSACYEQALEACDFILAIAPDDVETLKNKFSLLENVDSDENRLEFYLKIEKIALESQDESFLATVWLRIAQEYEMDALYEEAEIYYHRMLDKPALRQYALFRLGVIADFRRSYHVSLAYFDQALYTDTEETDAYNKAGIYRGMTRTLFNMGDEEAGMKYAFRAVETNPENRFHLYAYVYDSINHEKERECLAYVEKEISRQVKPELILSKAVLYYFLEREEESYGLFVSAFAADLHLVADISHFFPEILTESRQVNKIWEDAVHSDEKAKEYLQNMEGEEPFLYYGPDES